jgi:uncharacterized protein
MKLKQTTHLLIMLGLWLSVAAGCSFMAPQRDPTQWYVLSPVAGTELSGVSAASTSQLALGLGPIKFPDYLKRPWMVTRASSNRLVISDEKRWSEPLDQNFASVLRQDLTRLLGTPNIAIYPWYANNRIDYQIEVQVDSFETTDDSQSALSAVWTIRNGRNGAELASGRSIANAPVQGKDGEPAALSDDLGQMSRQIAARITELNGRLPQTNTSAGVRPQS